MIMEWECHECGFTHSQIPEQCEQCGAEPEIVANVWRCAHCGEEGISSELSACPACKADRALGVETAVGTEKLDGARARALAEGDWLYCAYCDVQVPPVDAQGAKNDACPT